MSNNFSKLIIGKIFSISDRRQFEELAIEVFRYQAVECLPYKEYLELLGCCAERINTIPDIPCLPVQLFKSRNIVSGLTQPEKVFTSSATTGMTPSRHPVTDISIYNMSLSTGFRIQYGNPGNYAILALLPSYLERKGSSLVHMVDMLMKESGNPDNGFYLYNYLELYNKLLDLRQKKTKCILIGVSFALLDFAAKYTIDFPALTVIETGGMKGRDQEISRNELHKRLKQGFGVDAIHSEYGMAELLSQAYSSGDGLFSSPPWMEILIRDLNNPFRYLPEGARGGINIIDLANINSCSFIETMDLGIKTAGGSFEILGRIQNSELRGCNLLLD
jgi:hypothetical protein